MSRVCEILSDLKQQGQKTVMPFVCGGHPGADVLPELLLGLERGGARIVEVGVPFSDPIADGPTIAAAMQGALEMGVTPELIFEQVKAVRPRTELGLVAMVSVSIVSRMSDDEARAKGHGFVERAEAAGFDGLIVPDIPPEQGGWLVDECAERGLSLSFLVGPYTPDDRAQRIVDSCTGFVYLLARAGITGQQEESPEIEASVGRLRQLTELPIACGFGISSAEHVRAVVAHADAAIVGSALVSRLTRVGQDGGDVAAEAERFTRELLEK